jgi:septum formation protein
MRQPELILASRSPRRKELLIQFGADLVVVPSDVDERVLPGEFPATYAERIAGEKAVVVAEGRQNGIVVAADTIVVINAEILGKPADNRDAARMLRLLSGNVHEVITGIAVRDAVSGRSDVRISRTSVWFRRLTEQEIEAYVLTGEPLDKAGAYGIQGRGALLIERIEGCYFNVVGLPLSLLGVMLKSFGIDLLMQRPAPAE